MSWCLYLTIHYKDDQFRQPTYNDPLGSTKANGREPKTGLGPVFNIKLGCFDDVYVLIYADAPQHL